MTWTAIVPIKGRTERKTRLAARLSAEARASLSDAMVAHVLACLHAVPMIGEVLTLSPAPTGGARWIRDEGRGLNAELAAAHAAFGARPVLIVHGDLPLLDVEDVAALVAAAEDGIALAPDRRNAGTNAIARSGARPFAFAFGEGSAERHRRAAGRHVSTVHRTGLALDVDTPEDFDLAIASGAKWLGHATNGD